MFPGPNVKTLPDVLFVKVTKVFIPLLCLDFWIVLCQFLQTELTWRKVRNVEASFHLMKETGGVFAQRVLLNLYIFFRLQE